MAEVVLGIGVSHTPMLYTPAEAWPSYESRDRRMELLDQDGAACSFDELVERAGSEVVEALRPEALQTNHDACQEHLDRLAEELESSAPDAVVVIGDDQKELFQEENLPAILLYAGTTIMNKKRIPKHGEPGWWSGALSKYYGDGEDEHYPVDQSLANHLARHLNENAFDIALSRSLPEGMGEGHAFAFIHSRLLRRRPVPVVPVFLNTYYPPNQPTPPRCYDLGTQIRRAVESFEPGARVAIIASGGLSHFVIDEKLDAFVLEALASGDVDSLLSLEPRRLNSGTSEIRNWIAMYGAAGHLDHQWASYVPAYRTPAGTGTGCGFAVWR